MKYIPKYEHIQSVSSCNISRMLIFTVFHFADDDQW